MTTTLTKPAKGFYEAQPATAADAARFCPGAVLVGLDWACMDHTGRKFISDTKAAAEQMARDYNHPKARKAVQS